MIIFIKKNLKLILSLVLIYCFIYFFSSYLESLGKDEITLDKIEFRFEQSKALVKERGGFRGSTVNRRKLFGFNSDSLKFDGKIVGSKKTFLFSGLGVKNGNNWEIENISFIPE